MPPPCSTDTLDAPAWWSRRSRTATGSPTAARSTRTRPIACVRAALDAGITTFDTADVYRDGRGRDAARHRARGSAPRLDRGLHEGLLADGPEPEQPRPVAQAHHRVLRGLAAAPRHRPRGPAPGAPLRRTRRRSKRRCAPSTTSSARARCTTSGSRSGPPRRSPTRVPIAGEIGLDRIVSNQPQYSLLWRVPEAEVIPTCDEHGIGQIVWSPLAQGVLTGKYAPGQPVPEGSRAADEDSQALHLVAPARRGPRPGPEFVASSRARRGTPPPTSPSRGCCATRTWRARSPGPHGPSRSPRTPRRPTSSWTTTSSAAIDEALEPTVLRDPAMTASPSKRPSSEAHHRELGGLADRTPARVPQLADLVHEPAGDGPARSGAPPASRPRAARGRRRRAGSSAPTRSSRSGTSPAAARRGRRAATSGSIGRPSASRSQPRTSASLAHLAAHEPCRRRVEQQLDAVHDRDAHPVEALGGTPLARLDRRQVDVAGPLVAGVGVLGRAARS